MANSTAVGRARRSLIWLGVVVVLLGLINGAGVLWSGGSWAPKLGLDLEGGTQIILAPEINASAKDQTVSSEELSQAVAIIRQRVNGSGISEAQVSTQGADNIVVSIPGTPDKATLERIEASASLQFRSVLAAATGTATASATSTATATPTATPAALGKNATKAEKKAAKKAADQAAASASAAATSTATSDATDPYAGLANTPTASPTDGSDLNWATPRLQAEFENTTCSADTATKAAEAPANKAVIACDGTTSSAIKYILGPVELTGSAVSDASAGLVETQNGASTGEWAVNIDLNKAGTKKFAAVSQRLYALSADAPRDQFAFVIDGNILSAPSMNAVITDGNPQITGSFTEASSKALADQLKYGALPISFSVQSQNTISATLGTSQLFAGLLAGLIGLGLVVIYSLIQYRALASVTIASLVVAGVVTYLVVNLLSTQEGYRLSLAGVAGLIVSIGITADSFIVYFERVRDGLREGRGLSSAVDVGWTRALRTILASDGVNFLAAAVLYLLAVSDVQGFALTLGITTIVDVFVVTLFTHPMLQLLSRRRFFSEGHRFSGLDPQALGAVYRGRARFVSPGDAVSARTRSRSSNEAARRQTIAERKAAENGGSGSGSTGDAGKDS